jgi:hypothetical protein
MSAPRYANGVKFGGRVKAENLFKTPQDRLRERIARARCRSQGAAGDGAEGGVMTWNALAHAAIQHLIERRTPFSTNDVWQLVDRPAEPRAVGQIIMAYVRSGDIVATGQWVTSAYGSRHGAPVREWVAS